MKIVIMDHLQIMMMDVMIMIVLFKMVGIVNMLNLAHQLVLLNVEITFQPVNRNVMMVTQ